MRQIGSRVKIAGQKGSLGIYFNGRTGRVVGTERDGSTTLYRVRLDEPTQVPGVGLVEDDLWAGTYLRSVPTPEQREARRAAHWRRTGVRETTIAWMKATGMLGAALALAASAAGHTPSDCGKNPQHETTITKPCRL